MENILAMLGQFGAAGLIGMLWIIERRHASHRDRQLDEAHQRLASQRDHLDALLDVVKDNTRAISSLEQGQRHLIDLLKLLRNGRGGRDERPHAHSAQAD